MNDSSIRNQVHQAVEQVTNTAKPDPLLAQRIRVRAQGKEEEPVKKRLSFGMGLVIALLVLSMGIGIAAVARWNVISFLFSPGDDLSGIDINEVHQESVSDGALMRVESVIYDGSRLAFDWHVENTKPETPICMEIEEFTANGIQLYTDGTDDFEHQWLPIRYIDEGYEENYWEGGEFIRLPEELRKAEQLHVVIRVKAYRPVRPVYYMDEFDPEQIGGLIEAGYFVIPEGEGTVDYDEKENEYVVCRGVRDFCGELREETLTIVFDVKRSDSVYEEPDTSGANENGYPVIAEYETAEFTPLGLFIKLNIRINEESGYRSLDDFPFLNEEMSNWKLTDDAGNPLRKENGDLFEWTGGLVWGSWGDKTAELEYNWGLVKPEELPDRIALSCISENGEKMVFPLKIR